jgi:hypothetical protein
MLTVLFEALLLAEEGPRNSESGEKGGMSMSKAIEKPLKVG